MMDLILQLASGEITRSTPPDLASLYGVEGATPTNATISAPDKQLQHIRDMSLRLCPKTWHESDLERNLPVVMGLFPKIEKLSVELDAQWTGTPPRVSALLPARLESLRPSDVIHEKARLVSLLEDVYSK